MAKGTTIGIDIGHDQLKLAVVSGNSIKKLAVYPMPENMINSGEIASVEGMSQLIKAAMKENGIHAKNAAVILSGENVFFRNITMPQMTQSQLDINLPYEFRDYITDEIKNYLFDYSVVDNNFMTPVEEEEHSEYERYKAPEESSEPKMKAMMKLSAAAVPKTMVEEMRDTIKKAGLRFEMAAPTVYALSSLIRAFEAKGNKMDEYCFIDLGYSSVRMVMFEGDTPVTSRVLETGMSVIDRAIADKYNVDIHLAHTYLITNYDNCQDAEECKNAYNAIAVELMRALNFFKFSNPDSKLSDAFLIGGGAAIEALRTELDSFLELELHPVNEILGTDIDINTEAMAAQAAGIAMN